MWTFIFLGVVGVVVYVMWGDKIEALVGSFFMR